MLKSTNFCAVSVHISVSDVAASPIANADRVDERAHLRVLRALLLLLQFLWHCSKKHNSFQDLYRTQKVQELYVILFYSPDAVVL